MDPNLIPRYFYTFLLFLGIIFYLSWSILYGRWFDPGVYAVSVVLIGFGIVGMWLYK